MELVNLPLHEKIHNQGTLEWKIRNQEYQERNLSSKL